jgi:hypothetical protein
MKMNTHNNGVKEFGIFFYENREVRGYGLSGGGGGVTSVFSFLTKKNAISFYRHIENGNGSVFVNGAQVVFVGDYSTALDFIPKEKIDYRSFSRSALLL